MSSPSTLRTRPAEPEKLRARECLCDACGHLFGGLAGFDDHRVGDHGVSRRCLAPDELTAKGYEQNARGAWRKPWAVQWVRS